ncbi:MAG: hypothetical protein R3202_14015, partial [Candidatus Competibacterales bacterium]|nr:hypothetical protein [Candidatus Competibacterales bacterium]
MTWLDLLALTPILLLVLGAATILLASAWRPEPLPLIAGGILVALFAVLAGGVVPSPVAEICGLFHGGAYGRFFIILWALVAALILMLSHRYISERGFAAGEYVSLVLFSAAGMGLL